MILCCCTTAAVETFAPPDPVNILPVTARAKIQEFEENADEIDVVLVGSSRVYRQLDSHVIGRAMSKRVYNLGSPGFFTPGTIDLVDHLRKRYPDKIYVLEIAPLEVCVSCDPRVAITQLLDTSKFEDPVSTYPARSSIVTFAATDMAYGTGDTTCRLAAAQDAVQYALAWGLRSTGFGRRWLYADRNDADLGWIRGRGGFVSLEEEVRVTRSKRLARRQRDLQEATGFDKKLSYENIVAYNPAKDGVAGAFRELVTSAAADGTRVILLAPVRPSGVNGQRIRGYINSLPADMVIDLQYPAALGLADVDLWFDSGHLNDEGTRVFSLAFGQALSEKLKNVRSGDPRSP